MLSMERRPEREESGPDGRDGVGGNLFDGEQTSDAESILKHCEANKSFQNDLLNMLNPLSPFLR